MNHSSLLIMTHLLQSVRFALMLTFALVISLNITDARAQITVSIDDIEPWYGRTLSIISSQSDSLADEFVTPIIDAVGENAVYDFRGIPFGETFRGTMRYLRMTPDGPGGDIDHLLTSTTVLAVRTENVEGVRMVVMGVGVCRDDSVM